MILDSDDEAEDDQLYRQQFEEDGMIEKNLDNWI